MFVFGPLQLSVAIVRNSSFISCGALYVAGGERQKGGGGWCDDRHRCYLGAGVGSNVGGAESVGSVVGAVALTNRGDGVGDEAVGLTVGRALRPCFSRQAIVATAACPGRMIE